MHKQFWMIAVLIIGVSVLGLIVGIGGYGYSQLQPVNQLATSQVVVIIPRGAGVAKIASLLEKNGVIRNARIFAWYLRLLRLDTQIQSGSYQLTNGYTASDVVAKLQQGSEQVWVLIPEGLRIEEVAERFAQAGLTNFSAERFIKLGRASEGQLFPDSYLVSRDMTEVQVLSLLTNTFKQKVSDDLGQGLNQSSRDLKEVLILASLVQREGRTSEDMRHVAGILQNRLKLGMKLDIDATLSYARGYDTQNQSWWSAPDPALKAIDSPYNTYIHATLPPTPIANPGLEAIEAVLSPQPSDDLFYLHGSDGQPHYAPTLAEHQHNITRYLR